MPSNNNPTQDKSQTSQPQAQQKPTTDTAANVADKNRDADKNKAGNESGKGEAGSSKEQTSNTTTDKKVAGNR